MGAPNMYWVKCELSKGQVLVKEFRMETGKGMSTAVAFQLLLDER